MSKQARKTEKGSGGEAEPHTPENYDSMWDEEVREASEVTAGKSAVRRLDFFAEFKKSLLFSMVSGRFVGGLFLCGVPRQFSVRCWCADVAVLSSHRFSAVLVDVVCALARSLTGALSLSLSTFRFDGCCVVQIMFVVYLLYRRYLLRATSWI
jgi:hypothetical protein